jgi:hypothetical protein
MAPASQLYWAQSEFVLCGAAHHLTINHARSDLEMVHGPRDERPAPRLVITPSRDEPNAHGIAAKPSAGKPLRDRQGPPGLHRLHLGRSPDWLKFKNPEAPAVKAEEDRGR